MFSLCTAWRTSSTLKLCLVSRSPLIKRRISRRWPPLRLISPTPGMVCRARRTCLSAISVSSRRLIGPGDLFADVLGGPLDVALKNKGADDARRAFKSPDIDLIQAADRGNGILEG